MLSTFLVAALAAFPSPQQHAQVRQAPVVNLLPEESLAVVELTLEPWDRLRTQTTAHNILRGRNLLKSRMSHPDLKQFGDTDVMRKIMGSVRISLSATPETLMSGCIVVTLEPANVGAASFDWETLLKEESGIAPEQVSRGYMTLMGDVDPEDDAQLLAQLAKRGRDRDRVLAGNAKWKALRSPVRTADDLMRASFLSWNMGPDAMSTLLSMTGDPSAAMAAPMLSGAFDFFGLSEGAIWTTSIQGDHFVDRQYVPNGKSTARMMVGIGEAEAALADFAEASAEYDSFSVSGVNALVAGQQMASWLEESMLSLGMDISQEPEFVEMKDSVMALLEHVGPRFVMAQNASNWPDIGFDHIRVDLKDRAAFDASMKAMPAELSAGLAMLQMQMQMSGWPELSVEENSIRSGEMRKGEPGQTLGDLPAFNAARAEILSFLDGREPVMLSLQMPSLEKQVLLYGPESLSSALEALGMGGLNWGPPVTEEMLTGLRPTWVVGVRTDTGLLLETHSNFSAVGQGLLAAGPSIEEIMMLVDEGGSDFNEEEF